MDLFSKPDPKKQLKETKKDLTKVQRELDRDRLQIEKQEAQLVAEIKKAAKQGNDASAKVLAKQLVRLRNQKTKNLQMKAQISGIGYQTTAMASNVTMGNAMKGATKAMTTMNKQVNLPQLQKNLQEFERQNVQMDMAEELMSDSIDAVMDGEDDEEESDQIMNQVLDEIGIDISSKLSSVPSKTPGSSSKARVEEDDLDDQLLERMARLKE